MSATPEIVPSLPMPVLKAALRQGAVMFARARGIDPQMVSDALIDSMAVAIRAAARNQRHDQPHGRILAGELRYRDPATGEVIILRRNEG